MITRLTNRSLAIDDRSATTGVWLWIQNAALVAQLLWYSHYSDTLVTIHVPQLLQYKCLSQLSSDLDETGGVRNGMKPELLHCCIKRPHLIDNSLWNSGSQR